MKVAVLGPTGETGTSVVDGLLASSHQTFDVTALVRPASLHKPSVLQLQQRGVAIVPIDLDGPEHDITALLQGIEVVISCALVGEVVLANAAKKADVKRFIPSFFATVMPRGLMDLRDNKEAVLDHIQRLHLAYTVIDVGWWYQISLPRLPSGRFDRNLLLYSTHIAGTGDVPSARTDLRDIGKYVARIIADPRTLNQKVMVYTDLRTHNEIYDTVEKISNETIPRKYLTAREIDTEIAKAKDDPTKMLDYYHFTYHKSWDILGENTPGYARYLGYLISKDLYPDLDGISFEDFVKETLDVGLKPMYDSYRDQMRKYSSLAFKGEQSQN